MLTVDLSELRRKGRLRLRGAIAGDDPLWGETEFAFSGDVTVDLTAEELAGEQVIVHGKVQAEVTHPCSRCLEEAREAVDLPVQLVWAPRAERDGGVEGEEGDKDDDLRVLDSRAAQLDVEPAIREEVLLAVSRFPLCRADCRGLCPVCGVNRNVEECGCDLASSDARWGGLRALSDDSGLR
jgi:uncharacterized protein